MSTLPADNDRPRQAAEHVASELLDGGVLIGIDAGTSVIKAVAFSTDGEALASSSVPNDYRSGADGAVEQDIERTWESTLAVLERLLTEHPSLASATRALAVTGQGDGTWLIDGSGRAAHDAWLWLDSRSAFEAEELARSAGIDTIYTRTGTGINVCQMRTQLNWICKHDPELLARASTAFHCKDYLYYRLTGERATDPSEGVFTFGNFTERDYDDEVIAALGLSAHRPLLPPIVDGIHESHALDRDIARRLGLPIGLPVVLGYVDVICTALGGGLYAPQLAPGLSVIGSTGMHMKWLADAEEVTLNADRSGYTMAFPGGGFAQMQSNMAATLNIDWFLDLAIDTIGAAGFTAQRGELLARFDALVESSPPAAVLYHPYISQAGERGPFTAPEARAGFTGLDQSVGFAGLLRAVYEGLALAARDCFDAMGERPGEIRLSGGAARSRMLRHILSSALDRPLRIVDVEEAGAAGACMIAATQVGLFDTLDDCCRVWVDARLGEAIEPQADLVGHYRDLLPVYRRTREVLMPVWSELADLRRHGTTPVDHAVSTKLTAAGSDPDLRTEANSDAMRE